MNVRDKSSLFTEWLLKFAVIFFVASLFFERYILNTLGSLDGFSLGFFVKIIVVVIFGIIISVLERNIFKIVAFATIITGSLFKLLIYIQDDFTLLQITELADYILLIVVSVYYLSRHFRKRNKGKSKDKKLTWLNREEANKSVHKQSSHRHHHHKSHSSSDASE